MNKQIISDFLDKLSKPNISEEEAGPILVLASVTLDESDYDEFKNLILLNKNTPENVLLSAFDFGLEYEVVSHQNFDISKHKDKVFDRYYEKADPYSGYDSFEADSILESCLYNPNCPVDVIEHIHRADSFNNTNITKMLSVHANTPVKIKLEAIEVVKNEEE